MIELILVSHGTVINVLNFGYIHYIVQIICPLSVLLSCFGSIINAYFGDVTMKHYDNGMIIYMQLINYDFFG